MKIALSWLKEYIQTDLSAEEIARLLTASGLEVESLEEKEAIKGGMKGLVIGRVLTCVKHPNADKLSLTTVDVGGPEALQIVCGAPNVAAGQKVVVAVPGTTVHPVSGDPFEIKKSKIRGEVSNGMICAEDEIGLGASHAGIIVLPETAEVGMLAKDYYGLKDDVIFEIGLTPNRADAASHFGVARDLAAVIHIHHPEKKTIAQLPALQELPVINEFPVEVIVEDKEACPRYSGLVIKGVEVKESPDWLKNKLRSIGVGPINNIVDVTNYVLHELGQPLHAFDADQIKGNKVRVRKAGKEEKFVTLDHVERKLNPTDLMICNDTDPMCIAGVFGGERSGISGATRNVFLESAYFSPASIRKTSKLHGLKTDASFRYERGTDPEITVYALKRAANLILQVAGGTIASGITDSYPEAVRPFHIELGYDYLHRFSGLKIEKPVIKSILTDLGIKILSESTEGLILEVPSYKVDVTRPVDLVEEILRVYGYDSVPVPSKINASIPTSRFHDSERFQSRVAAYLSDNGFNEILSNSLTRSEYLSLSGWNEGQAVKMLNPLSNDLAVLRQSMLESGLEAVQYNRNRKNADLRLFEFGKVYHSYNETFSEEMRLSVFITGNKEEDHWKKRNVASDFYQLKAYVENVLSLCGYSGKKLKMEVRSGDECSYGLTYSSGKHVIAQVGAVQSALLKKFDILQPVFYADFRWTAMMKYASDSSVQFRELPRFHVVKRDLSMMVPKEVNFEKLMEISYKTETKLLKEVRLFDIYEGDKIEAGKKSLALSFFLLDETQTLTDKQIEKSMERLMSAFEKDAGAVIRKA